VLATLGYIKRHRRLATHRRPHRLATQKQKDATMLELECLIAAGVLISIGLALIVAVRPKSPHVRLRRLYVTEA